MQDAENLEQQIHVAKDYLISTHPELHHYTSSGGIEGILKNQTLWATLYRDLNDSSEIEHFKAPLVRRMSQNFEGLLRTAQSQHFRVRRKIEKIGGLEATGQYLASGLVDSYYNATFGEVSSLSSPPFIASFCTHASTPYEQKNGLLSQWRAYGEGGGFCLVFDTKNLASLLATEVASHDYIYLNIDAVEYSSPESFERLFTQLMPQMEILMWQVIERTEDIKAEQTFVPFVRGATLYKHEAFREESEVRIVAKPASPKVRAEIRKMVPILKPLRRVESSERHHKMISHISLFDGLMTDLPIKRIIVGPSAKQNSNIAFAKKLVSGKIPVEASATPFIG